MGTIDSVQERKRLAALYATMSDEELEKIGQEPAALTEWARETLRIELAKRGLAWQELPERKPDKPVILRRYRDVPAAFVEKSALENAGIECFLQDDNVVRLDWFWSNAMGGIKLIVRESEAEEASKILSEARPQDKEDAASN